MAHGIEQLDEAAEKQTREEIANASLLFASRVREAIDRFEQANALPYDVDRLRGVSSLCELLAFASERTLQVRAFAELSHVYIELSNAVGELDRHDAADTGAGAVIVTKISELATRAAALSRGPKSQRVRRFHAGRTRGPKSVKSD